jgi:2,3-bisphosphoglycerate-independent phosphoglycerate mutase
MKNTITAITADHCTCCNLKRHCVGEVPLLIYGNGKDSLNKFSEKFCKEGSLGKIESLDFMKKLIEIAKN